jgi:hypothetical protein
MRVAMTQDYDERYEVRDPQIESILHRFGQLIADNVPDGLGFGLFLFTFDEHGAIFWISNGNRTDILNMLQEFIDREKKKP